MGAENVSGSLFFHASKGAWSAPWSERRRIIAAGSTLDDRAGALVQAYRRLGYRAARLDPLGIALPAEVSELDPARHGIGPADLRRVERLLEGLRATYCAGLALDCEHVRDQRRQRWLWQRMESRQDCPLLSPAERERTLGLMVAAEAWEHLLNRRFPAHKRFSLEGCEALVPVLDRILRHAALRGSEQVVLGMAHRGRLNVLVNVLGVAPSLVLSLFTTTPDPALAAWDLKYHVGCSTQIATPHGALNLLLAHNPSHLESVGPVVCGMARALQDVRSSARVLPVLVHGDAAFCGQGVVMETLNLSATRGYGTGGTVHVVLNNQIGFTTSEPSDARSMAYCTDVARMIDAPVLHVNAEDADAAVTAAAIAVDYRREFASDIVIDLVGFRRQGHNEQDVPELTQPHLQRRIAAHPRLVAAHSPRLAYEAELVEARLIDVPLTHRALAEGLLSVSRLQALAAALARVPEGFTVHPDVHGFCEGWLRASRDPDQTIDWRAAENLAYACVLTDGGSVRISGMDVRRGTFFHRHAVWHDQADRDGVEYVPLRHLDPTQGRFDVFDSPLSEAAVLGFEYGYSVLAGPGLVVWEAQYGDFVNNAQVVIDHYLATGEVKWGYRSGLVVLLPHGHEGVGPEHSSAHLGRFLQLCADDNLRVAIPSTAAQLFHLLRQQAQLTRPKPLIVMTPKSSLHDQPLSHSPLRALAADGFQPVLADSQIERPERVRRVVLAAGKIYYDLLRFRDAAEPAVALVRLEELHPFPEALVRRELARFTKLSEVLWVQEEARNHGAWSYIRELLEACLPPSVTLRYVGRPAAAPSAGCSLDQHLAQQQTVVQTAMATSDSSLRAP